MGTSYSSGVFFGAVAKRGSPLADILDGYIDRAGGCAPASTEIETIEIDVVGSQPTGETWFVVQSIGSARSYGSGDEMEAPALLVDSPPDRAAIERFLAGHGHGLTPIGWYFAGSAD
jgi:hypothetical protein